MKVKNKVKTTVEIEILEKREFFGSEAGLKCEIRLHLIFKKKVSELDQNTKFQQPLIKESIYS